VSRIQCRLETGRTHQIRIHMCESGHPLCGEDVYRSSKPFSEQISDRSKIPRIGLHAATLGFRHPLHDVPMVWESQLPDDLGNWWDSMNS
jgi:23S rRNA pseudouridine1911/1915/1917 synthase